MLTDEIIAKQEQTQIPQKVEFYPVINSLTFIWVKPIAGY